MNKYRLFIAINLPQPIQQSLKQYQQAFKAIKGLRFTPPENIHLTLQFLGDVPLAKIPQLETALRQEVSAVPSFNLRLSKLGVFPNFKRPRVVWVGLSGNAAILAEAYEKVIQATQSAGFTAEQRPFKPHLTIARVQKWARQKDFKQIEAAVKQNQTEGLMQFPVNEIHLMRSQLQPTGPIYSALATISFRSA